MSIFEAVVLGVIQGLTEFLPVSSSGHLQLLHALLPGGVEESFMFDVWLHVGTLVPVFIVFRKTIFELIKKPFQRTTLFLVIGTVPAVLAALLFGDWIDALFSGSSVGFMAFTFAVTGCLLLFADWAAVKLGAANGKTINQEKKLKTLTAEGAEHTEKNSAMTWLDALIIGCAQAAAIPPGISRSGATITAALGRGFNREEAAKFVFLLSIPAILGATVLQVVRLAQDGFETGIGVFQMGAGFVAAALSGYIAVNFMLALIKKARLRYFSVYVFALAAFIAVDTFILGGRVLGA